MSRKIFLIFVFCLFVSLTTGCKKKCGDENGPSPEPTEAEIIAALLKDEPGATEFRVYFNYMDGSDYQKVEVQKDKIVMRPEKPIREGYRFIDWYIDSDFSSTYQFSTLVTKSIMLYAKWEEFETVDYSYLLDEYVPNEVSDNLTFPNKIQDVQGSHLIWTTSDPYTITNLGVVNPGRKDITVTVNLEVNIQGESSFYSRDCLVKGIEFGSLQQGDALFGYCSTWNFNGFGDDELTEERLKVDALNVSFAYVNNDFTLDMSDILPSLTTETGYLAARKKGVRVVLSIQGYGDNSLNFSKAASNDATRKKFARVVLEAMEKYHFDGVDIDWEYPGWFSSTTSGEAENFTLLIKELYDALKAKDEDYLITAAIPAGAYGYVRYNLKDVSEYLDYIHLMSYDLEASSQAVHHTALYSDDGRHTTHTGSGAASVDLFVRRGVPIEKIVLGVAFYGKYTTVASSVDGGIGTATTSSSYKTMTYTVIYNRYLSRIDDGVTYYFDKKCQAPYLYVEDEQRFITYDDEKSIKAKCQYVRDNDLGGVMIWEIGEDGIGTLMEAVNSGMRR